MMRRIKLCTAILLLLLLLKTCNANSVCSPSSCGKIHNITFPFRLSTDPKHCGNHRYTLHCQNNSTLVLYLYSGNYYVQSINYNNFTIRLVDSGVVADDCSSRPHFPLTNYNFSLQDPFAYHFFNSNPSGILSPKLSTIITFMTCSSPANSPLYVDTSPCLMNIDNHNQKQYSYVDVGRIVASDLMNNCSIEMMSLLPEKDYTNRSFIEIHRDLGFGFELSWHYVYCGRCRGCYFNDTNNVQCISDYFKRVCYLNFGIRCIYLIGTSNAYQMFFRITRSTPTVLVLLVLLHCVIRTICGSPLILGFFIYKWRRRHLSGYNRIEEFLEHHNNLKPIRYSYSEIRKMTEGFKDKLGEGGFGCVYKGKLRSGQVAAIKILGKSKTNGQDFMNEVATIGRIYHTNVVQLIGFCVDGSKRALVYEFMPNGSLDKYVSSKQGSILLSWNKLHEISLAVARGIEYLHKGCDMQILHFDIKPHNILLDENFTPKISDFGLAKLYATNNSIKSLTAARGTIGYMAPELFYRNIGNISYKADIYSYGMLLLEMSGKRKKLEENSSESCYFPQWVYDEVCNGNVATNADVNAEENKMAKQMIVVGLWCIQMKPSDRPPMNKVIEMLEAVLESVELPPKPILYPDEMRMKEESELSSISGFLPQLGGPDVGIYIARADPEILEVRDELPNGP
ncbi:rust resistance kinase Lr10-like isoform X2 [Euphorbia lathyris]|uniref:rust resistance kinase Lr10-like isoform X2 n=1 Tax=Euphorbia lathyris TaxID=212925 RepID=UPI003313F080